MIKVSANFIHLRGVRIKKFHIKLVLACGGAFFMGVDAASAWAGPFLFPVIFYKIEMWIGAFGKTGAAMAGCLPFFEGVLRRVAEQVSEDVEAQDAASEAREADGAAPSLWGRLMGFLAGKLARKPKDAEAGG
jgi:hypothetical protein